MLEEPQTEAGAGTCDVVEVVEAVQVQAAGFFVRRVGTLPAHAGGSDGVRRPDSTVGSGAGLKSEVKNAVIVCRNKDHRLMILTNVPVLTWIWTADGRKKNRCCLDLCGIKRLESSLKADCV